VDTFAKAHASIVTHARATSNATFRGEQEAHPGGVDHPGPGEGLFVVLCISFSVAAEEPPGPNPDGSNAFKAAHALWDELAKVIPLNTVSEERKLRAIVVIQERLLSFSADSLE
jgi:hypothetical protein